MSIVKESQIFDRVRKFKIFSSFSDDEFSRLSEILKIRHYDRNERIFWQDDTADAVFIIYSGLVKLEKTMVDGKAKTLMLLTEGDTFGFSEVFAETSRPSSARTLSRSVILVIEKTVFLKFLEGNFNFTRNILCNISRSLIAYNTHIEEITFLNLNGRIAALLLRLADKFGIPTKTGFRFRISLTQKEIADMVGTNRETVCKFLQLLLKKQTITIQDKIISIHDIKGLQRWIY